MDEFNYLMTMSTEPQASWSPGTNNDSPCDTPFSLTIIWLETHAQADHRPWDSLYTHLAFKNARLCQKLNFAESLWGAWDLGEPDPPVSLHGPAVKPFLCFILQRLSLFGFTVCQVNNTSFYCISQIQKGSHKFKIWGNPVLSKSVGAIFQTSFAHFVFLCPIW